MNVKEAKLLVEQCMVNGGTSQQVKEIKTGDIFRKLFTRCNRQEIFCSDGVRFYLHQLEIVSEDNVLLSKLAAPALSLNNTVTYSKESLVWDADKQNYVASDGSHVVWDGATGTYMRREDSLANSEKYLTSIGFKFGENSVSVSAPTMPALSLHNPTVIVKVIDTNPSKGEIVAYDGEDKALVANIASKGTIFTSTSLQGYAIDTMLCCEIEITGKGSRKVRSVQPYDLSHEKHIVSNDSESSTMPISDDSSPTEDEISTILTTTSESTEITPLSPTLNIANWEPDGYYISRDTRMVFGSAYQMLLSNPTMPVKVLLTGKSGTGKTTVLEHFATFAGLSFLRWNCATVRDMTDWYGMQWIVNDNGVPIMHFALSDLSKALIAGNCVVVLDELNRVEPMLHNALFPILDDSAETSVFGQTIKVGPNVIIAATINQGYEFGGTMEPDQALTNRFDHWLEVGHMPFDHEVAVLECRYNLRCDTASEIVRIATILRDNEFNCSTRDTLRIAKMMRSGLTMRDSFEFAIVRRVPNTRENQSARKAIVDLINVQLGERN